MKGTRYISGTSTWMLLLLMIACNRSGPASTNEDTATTPVKINDDQTSAMPAYDPAMDGINTGGTSVKKMSDTLNIKMYLATLKPGDSAVLHKHPDHTVYVLEGGKLAVYFNGAERQQMELKAGDAFISGPLSDAAKNIGNTTVTLLIHDIYRPRGKALQ